MLLLYLHGSNTTSCESNVGCTTMSKGLIVGIEKSEGMAWDMELMCCLEVSVDNVVCFMISLLSRLKNWSQCNGVSTLKLRWEALSIAVSFETFGR